MNDKQLFKLAIERKSDSYFWNTIVPKFEVERGVIFSPKFQEHGLKSKLMTLLYDMYKEDYKNVHPKYFVKPQSDIPTFDVRGFKICPYRFTSSKYWVFNYIYTYSPVARKELIDTLSDHYQFQKNHWNIHTSVDNTIYELKQEKMLDKDKKKRYYFTNEYKEYINERV